MRRHGDAGPLGSAGYALRKGVRGPDLVCRQWGSEGQRLAAFNASALQQGSTTVRMGPFGQYRGPVISTWNIKTSKVFTIHDRYHIEANFQVFNLLNSSAAVATNYLTGASTFSVVTDLISPRVARIGGLFTF